MSLRKGDTTPLEAGMTFHIIPALWEDTWGLEITESILITEKGATGIILNVITAGMPDFEIFPFNLFTMLPDNFCTVSLPRRRPIQNIITALNTLPERVYIIPSHGPKITIVAMIIRVTGNETNPPSIKAIMATKGVKG